MLVLPIISQQYCNHYNTYNPRTACAIILCCTSLDPAVVRAISSTHPKGSLRFYGYPEDKHVIGGNALMAGRALDWFIDHWVSTSEHDRDNIFKELDRAATFIDPGCHGLKFLPYLSGQLAPERRAGASATFHGLTINHTRNEMFRSVLEGSGFALCRVFNQVVDWLGEPESIGVTGSGVRGHTWGLK